MGEWRQKVAGDYKGRWFPLSHRRCGGVFVHLMWGDEAISLWGDEIMSENTSRITVEVYLKGNGKEAFNDEHYHICSEKMVKTLRDIEEYAKNNY